MSSWKKIAKRGTREHQERHQPEERQQFGLLEKKKDYQLRSRAFHVKQNKLKKLHRKAQNKNPNEFCFHMINSEVQDGFHYEKEKPEEHSEAQLKLMQTQDANYVNYKLSTELKSSVRLVQDFLVPALDGNEYGDLLKWDKKPIFAIRWTHKAKSQWTANDSAVFIAWDVLKGRSIPKTHQEFVNSKQRLRAALRNTKTVQELENYEGYRKYRITDFRQDANCDETYVVATTKVKKKDIVKPATNNHSRRRKAKAESSMYQGYYESEEDDPEYEPFSKTSRRKKAQMKKSPKRRTQLQFITEPVSSTSNEYISDLSNEESSSMEGQILMPKQSQREMVSLLQEQDTLQELQRATKRKTKVSQECWADRVSAQGAEKSTRNVTENRQELENEEPDVFSESPTNDLLSFSSDLIRVKMTTAWNQLQSILS